MADQADQELPPARRRRLIIAAVLRGLVVTTVLVVLYYLLPLDRPLDASTAVRILIGLLVFAGITVWQVKAIAGSRYPGLRAAEALGVSRVVLGDLSGSVIRGEDHALAGDHGRKFQPGGGLGLRQRTSVSVYPQPYADIPPPRRRPRT